MKQYSISQLARAFGLTRSALLYYDAVGVLKPAARTASNYRIYTDKEYKRLHKITSLRSTGVSLEQIQQIMDSDDSAISDILLQRIDHINNEIQQLRLQQRLIVGLLDNEELLKNTRVITKEMWVEFLESAGLDEEGMRKWHMEFEVSAPEAHQDFLESLGLSVAEIRRIREISQSPAP